MKNTLKITFNSDWHIGSGAGIPGSVDRQVLRDSDGLPYVPGKTITGILRDAAEWVAHARDEAEKVNRWSSVLVSLFGEQPDTHGGTKNSSTQAAKIGIGNAVFSEELKANLVKNKLIQSIFIVQPGVKIDPKTGCSLKDHLFFTEEVRGGCSLYAPIDFLTPLSEDENKLLEDAVKAIRRIGGKRRRGGGNCRVKLYERNQDTADRKVKIAPNLGNDDFVELDFRLTTLQPVIINNATLGNVVKSDAFIPGVSLLPYFFNKAAKAIGAENARNSILNGEFYVGNFLPEINENITFPAPLPFAKKKESDEIVNRFYYDEKKDESSPQLKDVRTGYIFPNGSCSVSYTSMNDSSSKSLRTHNTVEDKSQRPTSDVGGLFTYEAIKQGISFRGTVRLPKKFAQRLDIMSRDECSIGQSRKDEYGKIRLEFVRTVNNKPYPTLSEEKYLIVYLKSDVLIRNEYNSYSTEPKHIKEHLQKVLGVELRDVNLDKLHSYVRTNRRESWHSKWNLPRPSLVYFQAGSVLVFEMCGDWNAEKAAEVEKIGIGDRRAEGYGQILFNPEFLQKNKTILNKKYEPPKNGTSDAASTAADFTFKDEDDKKFYEFLRTSDLKRRFTQAARRRIYEEVHQKGEKEHLFDMPCRPNNSQFKINYKDLPSNSQFGALRELSAAVRDDGSGLSNIEQWIEHAKKKDKISKAWLDWLDEKIKKPEWFWEQAGMNNLQVKSLDHFALRTFFDILCEAVFDVEKKKRGEQE